MNCCQFQDKMSERLDKVLDTVEMADFDAHATECSDCQQVWQEFSRAWELLATLPALEPSPLFRAQVWDKLRQEPPRPSLASPWLGLRRWFGRGLVLASTVLLVSFLGHSWIISPVQEAPVLATLEMPRMGADDWDPSFELLPNVDYLAEESTVWEATPLPLGRLSHDYLAYAESALDETLEEH